MVPVPLHERNRSVQEGLLPHRVIAEDAVADAVVVALVVRIAHHVESVLVAKFIEQRHGRVVRGSDHVDVGLLHHLEVLPQGGLIHISSCPRMVFVAVHTLEFHLLAVDKQHFSLHLYPAYTRTAMELLDHLFPVHQPDLDIVKFRLFRRPESRVLEVGHQLYLHLSRRKYGEGFGRYRQGFFVSICVRSSNFHHHGKVLCGLLRHVADEE